jgi:DNA-binding response OmpR family regulator
MIVVADDDSHLLRVITLWLTRFGYDVQQARNGQELLELYRKHRPMLVVTDVNMPVMNGLDAARQILAEATAPVGIIVLSCRVDMIGVSDLLGSDHVIHHGKPFSPSRLIAEVRTLEQRVQNAKTSSAARSAGGRM